MDERIEIDLNGKQTLALRLVRAAMVAARAGWPDRLAEGQLLTIVDPCGEREGICALRSYACQLVVGVQPSRTRAAAWLIGEARGNLVYNAASRTAIRVP